MSTRRDVPHLLSVVVPLFNEEDNVAPLIDAVRDALKGFDTWELILVDDGSTDRTLEEACRYGKKEPRIVVLRLASNYGQTLALQAGFDRVRGDVLITMDGDLQNDPRDIPLLINKLDEGYDLVAGYRVARQDNVLRKIPSWVANRIIGVLTGVKVRDNGCSLKAYRRSLVEKLHLYSEMHRFIPAVAASVGIARIAEMPVRHHRRTRGVSKYGFSRIFKVLADLLTISMIRSFSDRPLRMFGIGALGAGAVGGVFMVGSILGFVGFHDLVAAAFVLPGVAMLSFSLAVYLLMLGLIAEVALREKRTMRAADSTLSPAGR